MNRLRREDGRTPFVLDKPQIIEVAHRAVRCRDVVATFVLASALTPFDPACLATSRIAGLDAGRATIAMPNPRGDCCRVGLGRAACAALVLAAAGRAKGFLFADDYGDPIRPDRDAEDYADELLSMAESQPLPFRFTFRSLREGVFAAMADGGVRQDVVLGLAGMGASATGPADAAWRQAEQRDASDWWAGEIGVLTGRSRSMAIRGPNRGDRGRDGRPGGGDAR